MHVLKGRGNGYIHVRRCPQSALMAERYIKEVAAAANLDFACPGRSIKHGTVALESTVHQSHA